MADIGPELPPHLLAKRKRKAAEEADQTNPTESGAKPPSSPPQDGEKRRRIVGPAMPPAPLKERPPEPANARAESESEDDDDFGPALPSAADHRDASNTMKNDANEPRDAETEQKPRRDEWMMIPPKQDDLATRMDPTKQRARGFNTGKGASATGRSDADNSTWYETPEQKKKRLADEMMGVAQPSTVGSQKPPKGGRKRDSDAARQKINAHTASCHACPFSRTSANNPSQGETRGPSLMDQHQYSTTKEAEDDPSTRAFDREKDMATGGRIGHSQRKELLNKASNFSSKFSGGSYL